MNDISIRVENLSKRYRIGAKEEQHDTFAGALLHQLRHPTRNLSRLRRLSKFGDNSQSLTQEEDVIWALKDVSFEVRRGEVIGVIGRNGAGKSTLLKILSRITHPTIGRIELNGRVSSLLEVGTGFHPELTGRENVYLNGTILGMRKTEIDHKFEEIVDFSGVEKFIDTPVKRYSSGMGVRLAFSVAAHLEPEILLVDEVLAVGDAEFQRKCLGKMDQVASLGRTILFVSHQMAAIETLCERVILLEGASIVADGQTKKIVNKYLASSFQESAIKEDVFPIFSDTYGIGILNFKTSIGPQLSGGIGLKIEFDIETREAIRNVGVGIMVKSKGGIIVSRLDPYITNYGFEGVENNIVHCSLSCEHLECYIAGGDYVLSLWLSIPRVKVMLKVDDVAVIHIPNSDIFGTGFYFKAEKNGFIPLPLSFDYKQLDRGN